MINDILQILKICIVTPDATDNVLVDFHDSGTVAESGERAVGAEHVGGDHHPVLVFDGDHGGGRRDRGPAKDKIENINQSARQCKKEKEAEIEKTY